MENKLIQTNFIRSDGDSMFRTEKKSIYDIIKWIDSGELSKYSVQRSYKWTPSDVKAFLESMFQNYPIGGFTLWQPSTIDNLSIRNIKYDTTGLRDPTTFIIDGQQRITSLYSIFTGNSVVKKNVEYNLYAYYNPIDDEFKVLKNPIKKADQWIPLSEVYNSSGAKLSKQIAEDIWKIRDKDYYSEFSEDDRHIIRERIATLSNLLNIKVDCSILKHSDVNIAMELFESINKGKSINRNEHILAMLSAWDKSIKDSIDAFARETSQTVNPTKLSFSNRIHLKLSSEDVLDIACYCAFKTPMLKVSKKIRLDKRDSSKREIVNIGDVMPLIFNRETWQEYIEILEEMQLINATFFSDNIVFKMSYVYYVTLKAKKIKKSVITSFIKTMVAYIILTNRYNINISAIKIDLNLLKNDDPISEYKEIISGDIGRKFWDNDIVGCILNETRFRSPINTLYHMSLINNHEFTMFSDKFRISDYYRGEDIRPKGIKDESRKIEVHHIYSQNSLKKIAMPKKAISKDSIANQVLMDENTHKKAGKGDVSPFQWLDICSDHKNSIKNDWMARFSFPSDFSDVDLNIVDYSSYSRFVEHRAKEMAKNIEIYFDNLWK